MDKNIKKSLQKEIFKKSINGEGHGAVAGNASAKNLNGNGSERLNHFALTHSNSAAKIRILFDRKIKKQKFDLESRKSAINCFFYSDKGISGSKSVLKAIGFKPSRTRDYHKQLVDEGVLEIEGEYKNRKYKI